MKRYSLLIIGALFLFAGNMFAQAPRIYSIPAAFDVNEDITLYLDVTGTALAGETGTMCCWSWSDAGDNKNNGGWGTFGNLLTKVDGEDNLYSVTVNMGNDYPAGATEIQALVVKQDASAQTENSDPLLPFNFSKVGNSSAVIYPAAFSASTPVSIVANITGSGIDINTAAVNMHSALDNWSHGNVAYDSDKNKTALSKVAGHDGIWRISFIPSEYFDVPENQKIINIMAVFNNGSWDQEMKDNGNDFAFVPNAGEDGPAGARFFLSNFGLDDVLPIIVNTTGLGEDDPLYEYNGNSMVFTVTLSDNVEGAGQYTDVKRIAARKTDENTYMLVLLPTKQFEDVSKVENIDVTFSAEGQDSSVTLSGSFMK